MEPVKTAPTKTTKTTPVKTAKKPVKHVFGPETINGITKNDIRRLFENSGIESNSKDVYEQIRSLIVDKTDEIVRASILFTEAAKHKTVMDTDVNLALEQLGTPFLSFTGSSKGDQPQKFNNKSKTGDHKMMKGEQAHKRVKFYKKSNETLGIRKLPFQRVVRFLASQIDSAKYFKFQSRALMVIQQFVEEFIKDLLSCANKLAQHAGRVKVVNKDIVLAMEVKGIPFNYSQ